MSVLVFIVIILCVFSAVWSWMKPRPFSPPFYPGALPFIGHLHLLIGDRKYMLKLLQKVSHCCLEKGGVIEGRYSLHTVYVVTDPDDSVTIDNICFSKPYFYDFMKSLLNNGLLTSKASTWKVHRKLLSPAFSQQVLNTSLNEINVQARIFVSQLAAKVGKEPFNIWQRLAKFTLKVISRTSLGLEPQNQALIDKDYKKLLKNILASYVERGQRPWLHLSYVYNMSELKRKEEELVKEVEDIINPVILKRKCDLKVIKNSDADNNVSNPENFMPLLDYMLNLANKQDCFTDEDIRDQINTFVAASYDTTTSTLKYILLMLGSYQDVQERVFTELQEVFGHEDTYCTKDVLPKLVYLEAVVRETLRLYPPASFIARNVDTDVKLKNYTLRAGSTCIVSVYGINRHPMWGADANEFKPERWLNPATLPVNPNAFASFGVGKRNCIGRGYSMMVMKTVLSHILRRYRITSDISNLESCIEVIIQAVEGDLLSLTLRK